MNFQARKATFSWGSEAPVVNVAQQNKYRTIEYQNFHRMIKFETR